jgi:2-polyprenyl-6-methoxyphenol hydroxylase-like FAD-dependent oxidoreductase
MSGPLPLGAVAAVNLRASGDGQIKSLKHSADALALVWCLAYQKHKTGDWPNQAEYAAYWKRSERTVQREWALFKRAFPTEQSPERLARWMLSELTSRIEQQQLAMAVLAPPELQAA